MQNTGLRILILGATGMLGHTLFRRLESVPGSAVFGTVRSLEGLEAYFSADQLARLRPGVDAGHFDSVTRALASVRPDLVINCIGVIKQLPIANDPLTAITINAQLPHRLSLLCRASNARLIHISSDCVFDGAAGSYRESDPPAPPDLYGRSKLLGEVDYPHCLTLRTSIIGHEMQSRLGLVEWFLSRQGGVQGFTRAIYSGFPTVEMSRIIAEYVLPNPELHGLYHVSSEPISKYDLLCLVREAYGALLEIEPYHGFVCDRSLDSSRFRQATGYTPPSWEELVGEMHADWLAYNNSYRKE